VVELHDVVAQRVDPPIWAVAVASRPMKFSPEIVTTLPPDAAALNVSENEATGASNDTKGDAVPTTLVCLTETCTAGPPYTAEPGSAQETVVADDHAVVAHMRVFANVAVAVTSVDEKSRPEIVTTVVDER
jgi:hypothetical protein